MTVEGTDHCGHHGDLVGVTIVNLTGEDVACSWCGGTASTGLVKSQRHKLAICEDCDGVLNGLYHEDMETQG